MFERTDLSITQQSALADMHKAVDALAEGFLVDVTQHEHALDAMRGDVKRLEAENAALVAERDEATALLASAMDGANQLGALGQRESDRADDAERRHEDARGCVHQLQNEVARLQGEVVAMRKERGGTQATSASPQLYVEMAGDVGIVDEEGGKSEARPRIVLCGDHRAIADFLRVHGLYTFMSVAP